MRNCKNPNWLYQKPDSAPTVQPSPVLYAIRPDEIAFYSEGSQITLCVGAKKIQLDLEPIINDVISRKKKAGRKKDD